MTVTMVNKVMALLLDSFRTTSMYRSCKERRIRVSNA
jgi:hypothetical protein